MMIKTILVIKIIVKTVIRIIKIDILSIMVINFTDKIELILIVKTILIIFRKNLIRQQMSELLVHM